MIDISLYTLKETIEEDPINIFEDHEELLTDLHTTAIDAWEYFQTLYENRFTIYSMGKIKTLADLVFLENKYKYEKLAEVINLEYDPIENYNMVESGTDVRTPNLQNNSTRTPNLTSSSTSTPNLTTTTQNTGTVTNSIGATDTTTKKTGTDTTTDTPNELTNTHKVNPYDSTDLSIESQDVQSGSKTTGVQYNTTDNTKTTATTNQQTNNLTNTTQQTGTNQISSSETGTETTQSTQTGLETTTHTLTRSGNIGVMTSQQMIQQTLDITDIKPLKIIFSDIAEKILINEIF